MKITTQCGDAAVAGLDGAPLVKAAAAKLLRTDKVRADTTLVALRRPRLAWAMLEITCPPRARPRLISSWHAGSHRNREGSQLTHAQTPDTRRRVGLCADHPESPAGEQRLQRLRRVVIDVLALFDSPQPWHRTAEVARDAGDEIRGDPAATGSRNPVKETTVRRPCVPWAHLGPVQWYLGVETIRRRRQRLGSL